MDGTASSNEEVVAATKLQAIQRGRAVRATEDAAEEDTTTTTADDAMVQAAPQAEPEAAGPKRRGSLGRSVRKTAARVTGLSGFLSGKGSSKSGFDADQVRTKPDAPPGSPLAPATTTTTDDAADASVETTSATTELPAGEEAEAATTDAPVDSRVSVSAAYEDALAAAEVVADAAAHDVDKHDGADADDLPQARPSLTPSTAENVNDEATSKDGSVAAHVVPPPPRAARDDEITVRCCVFVRAQ